MGESVHDQVFALVDAIYNDASQRKDANPDIMKVLLTAGKYLNEGKVPAQIIAAKTVNGITLYSMRGKSNLGSENAERINKLIRLARSEGYKWTSSGVGTLGVQF